MVENTEILGARDAQTDAGNLIIFMPKAFKRNNKEGELQTAVGKVLEVADGMDNGVDDLWDEPTPLNSMYPLNAQMQASDWVPFKANEIQLCKIALHCFEDQFLALLAAIEAEDSNSVMGCHSTKKIERN